MIGTFCLNSCPDMTSIISKNFDFIIIDREHGRISLDVALSLLNSANDNCEKFIRVSSCNRTEIQRVLEIKPDGILVPQVSSIEDAKNAIDFTFYPPVGSKGLSPYTRAFDFSPNSLEEKKCLHNENFKLSLLIEGEKGFNSLDEILIKFSNNIHMVYFGLFDYANALQTEAKWDNTLLIKNLHLMIDKCKINKIRIGTIARNKSELVLLKKLGVNYVVYQNDTGILNEFLQEVVKY